MSKFSKWIDKNILGTQDPNAVRNKILSNPYLDKWNELSEEYRDFNSDYYKQGKSFFSDIYNQQAQDTLATQMNINNRALSQSGMGGSGIGFAQNEASRARAMDQAFGQTNKSLMNMWQQGQQLSKGYGNQAANLYNSANEAYLNTKQQNDAARAAGVQGLLGFGINALAPGIGNMMNQWGELDKAGNKFGAWDSFRRGYGNPKI